MATSQPKIRTFVEIQTPDGKKYYVEPSTKFSTYTFPADAVIFSNVTKQIIYRPPGMNVNVKQHGDPAQCQPQQQGQLGSPPNPNPQQQPHPGQQQQQLTQQQQQAYMQQMRQQQQPGQPGVTPSPNPQQSQQLGQPGQPSPQQHLQSGQQQQQQPHPGQQQQQLTPQQQAYMQQMRMRQMQQQQMQQQQMQQQQMQQQQMQQQQMQQQQMRQPQSGHQQQQLTPQQQAYMQQMRMRHMQQQQMQQPKQPAFPAQQPPPPAFPSQQPPPPAFPAQQPPPPAFPSQQPPPPPFPVQAPPPPQQPTPTPPQQQPQQQAPPLPTGGAPSPPPPPPSLPPAGLASAQGGASLPPPTPPVSGDADPQQVPQQAPPPDILPPHIDSGAPQSPQPRPNQQSVNQRRPNSTNQNMLNSTNQRPNSINQGRPRSTTQGSRVLEPPYCGPPPFKLSQTHIPKTKELIQRYVPLILNMDLYFPPRRGHALYKNNSDPNLIGGSHSRHKSGELEFINLISETISYKSSDASEAEVNQLEEIASSPPPTPPSSAAEEQPSLPTPASEEQPSSPPPASEEQPSSPPPASEEQPSSPPPASEEQPSPPSSAAEEQPSLPTPATEEQPSSSPPAAEEQPSLPPPSTEEQPSPPSSAAEEPPPPHPPALAPAPKPKKPKPTKPTKPKHTETKEEIMSDGTKVQYIIEYEEEEEEEEAEEPTPDPAPTPEPAPTPDPEPTPEPAPAPAPAPVPKMFQKQEEPEIVLEEFKEEEECHEYAPVTFKATIDIKELVSMHFNLARSSNHDTIMNLCNAYSFEEFGKLNFRKFHVKGKFLRSEPIEALITYNEEPLYKPLLASVDESKKDLGNQISLAILTLDSQKVVRIINSDPTLIDEVYAQLIKYTSNCPNEDIAIKGWMTFLLISTLFAPTDLIRNYVISHMYKNFKNESCAIKMLAKFSFIRLKERICIGVNRHEEDSETMKLIPYACFYGLSMFHTSLYEIIWSQKKRFPKTPIPIPLYLICQALILLGLFRGKYPYLNSKPAGTNHKMFFTLIAYMPHSPVNLKNYALSNNGIDKEEKLKTVIDLLIYWLNTLTDSIIPASILDQFIELSEQNRFNAIIVLLPTVHFRTLEYLIGFLKHFLKYQKRTGMDIKKISEAFGPHIVVEPTRQLEEFQQRRVKKYAPMFCEYCLNFLDTSSLYPLNPEYITDKTKPQQPQLNA